MDDPGEGAGPEGMFWIECDIDGAGPRWRLAHWRGGEIAFPTEGFSDAAEGYAACPRQPVVPPGTPAPKRVEAREDGVAQDKADAADNAFALFVLAGLAAAAALVWRLWQAL